MAVAYMLLYGRGEGGVGNRGGRGEGERGKDRGGRREEGGSRERGRDTFQGFSSQQ